MDRVCQHSSTVWDRRIVYCNNCGRSRLRGADGVPFGDFEVEITTLADDVDKLKRRPRNPWDEILEQFGMEENLTPALLKAYITLYPALEANLRELYMIFKFGDGESVDEYVPGID